MAGVSNYHEDQSALAGTTKETEAALELLQFKRQRPSHEECSAVSELLRAILLRSAGDSSSSLRLPASRRDRRSPALLAAGKKDASTGEEDAQEENDDSSADSAPAPSEDALRDPVAGLPMPLADVRDGERVSPLQCYVRRRCTEFFAAAAGGRAAKGRQAVSEGRIGVRCVFCKHIPRNQQAAQATSFPNQVSSILSAVVMIQCRHFPHCRHLPDSVRERMVTLKRAGSAAAGAAAALGATTRQEYWAESARGKGFVDTEGGIRFDPRASGVLSSDGGDALDEKDGISSANDVPNEGGNAPAFAEHTATIVLPRPSIVSPFDPVHSSHVAIDYDLLAMGSQLVTLEDRHSVPDYVWAAFSQLEPCQLAKEDRIGAYRPHPLGFRGLCCRHCQGHQPGPGRGRFFPNSPRSLAQTTTTQTIVRHITSKCQHVPRHIKDVVASLWLRASEDAKPAYAPKKSDDDDGRPRKGSRKEFFTRVWDRLHGRDSGAAPARSRDEPGRAPRLPEEERFRPTLPPSPDNVPPPTDGIDGPNAASSNEDSLCVQRVLFDDRNRRVTIRGAFESRDPSEKQPGAFADTTASRKKTRLA